MPFHEILKQTLSALWETKLRSFLTMFGIVWGITSVILLVGLAIGFNIDQKAPLRSIGTDIAILFGGKTGAQSGEYPAPPHIRLPALLSFHRRGWRCRCQYCEGVLSGQC